MAGRTITKIIFSFALFAFLLAGCANQLPPGGGEVDRIPPEIIKSNPETGTINYKENYIDLEFSEYVNKRTLNDAIFVSPALDGPFELDWSGKSVRINFPGKLKEDKTYIVTIGTDLTDYNNNNKMAHSFGLVFSTGKNIDKRKITGKVFGDKAQGTTIFCYQLTGNADTLLKRKPDYISQTGADGSFALDGISTGSFRIFPVKDEYKNLLFDADMDEIGIPYTDVNFKEEDTLFSNLNFFLIKYDTLAPRLLNTVMTDRNHILLNFSEDLDSSLVAKNNFIIYDSTAQKKYTPAYIYKNNSKLKEIVLVVKDSITEGDIVTVQCKELRDIAKNIIRNEYSSVTITSKPDTIKPFIRNFEPAPGNHSVDYVNPRFNFYINDGVDSSKIKSAITFTDTSGNKINYDIYFDDDASFFIKPGKLETNKEYKISLNYKNFVDAAGNYLDSTYIYKFKTKLGLDYTGLDGHIVNYDSTKNPVVVLQDADDPLKLYMQKAGVDGLFNFEKVDAGKYNLWCFYDTNNNGEFDKGNVHPFKYSEFFTFYPAQINLRARWTLSDIKFIIKK